MDSRAALQAGLVSAPGIVLAGAAVAQMVRAAERAQGVPQLRLAIIGGLAVTCRLGHVHRATGDVDAVVDDVVGLAADSGAQLLVEAGIAEPDPGDGVHRVFINGTKLEIIDTQELPADVSDIAALDRLFVVGHRWALDSAEPIRVLVASSDVDVLLPVAAPAASSRRSSTHSAIANRTRSARQTRSTSTGCSRHRTATAKSQTRRTMARLVSPRLCTT
jgi:hypothetical protein